MATKTEAKEAKACKVAVSELNDSRWWPLPEVHKGLFRRLGPSTSSDIVEALKSEKPQSGKPRCVRRRANSSQCEEVPAEFWQSHRFFENSPYFGGLGIYDPAVTTVYDPQTHLDAREFYVWQPDEVWPVLARREIDARKAKPRRVRKRSTRKASQPVGTGSAIDAGNSAAATGSPNATEAGNTAAVAAKRKRKGKLTEDKLRDGFFFRREHPELKPKQAYPELRKVLKKSKSEISDTTLWRRFWKGYSELERQLA
jgi:hypothetical protein